MYIYILGSGMYKYIVHACEISKIPAVHIVDKKAKFYLYSKLYLWNSTADLKISSINIFEVKICIFSKKYVRKFSLLNRKYWKYIWDFTFMYVCSYITTTLTKKKYTKKLLS